MPPLLTGYFPREEESAGTWILGTGPRWERGGRASGCVGLVGLQEISANSLVFHEVKLPVLAAQLMSIGGRPST